MTNEHSSLQASESGRADGVPQGSGLAEIDIGDGTELLTFRSGDRRFAVDIMSVREIRGWSQPTPLPHSDPWLRGMVNLRGTVLPVMDLAQRLGRAPTEDDPRNVIIVIEEGGRVHGLLVQAVSDILRPSEDQLQEVPVTDADGEASVAERLFVTDDAMIQILSVDRLLRTTRPQIGSSS